MATLSHIPCPYSVAVKTAGYTIPVGRYARAVVNVTGTATFTIDTVTALAGTQNNVITSGNNLYRMNGTPVFSSAEANKSGSLFTGSGSASTVTPTGFLAVFADVVDQKNLVQDYFLPAGTVIGGTGTWRAAVEEYLGA